ncbi:MAG: pyridoxal-dependent decarboxylase [Gemmatimonadota bacterium]
MTPARGDGGGEESVPTAAGVGDMPPEEFHRQGLEVLEWARSYLEGVGALPVSPSVQPGELRALLPARPPQEGEGMDRIFRDFERLVLPGVTHWNHPSFHGYFAITGSGPGILGELISAALNVNAMLWKASPAATELEELVTDWVRDLLGLPPGFTGVIHDTASTSSLVALAAARQRIYPEVREGGLFGLPRGRIYVSEEGHSSIEKAAVALGLGREGVRKIPVDRQFRMRVPDLEAAIREDRARGVRPVAVVATIGTTSTTSVDPVREVADLLRGTGVWLHVDAAYAGPAAALEERCELFGGWEEAESIVVNPHKWLFTQVDCSVLLCRDPGSIRAAFSLVPEYLRTDEAQAATNFMDYGVALGHRFRALKLWFVLRYFGVEGIRRRLRYHIHLAQTLARRIEEDERWELMAPVTFSTVVFRFAPSTMSEQERDTENLRVMEAVNASGRAFISHTRVGGRLALRAAVGNLRTRENHIESLWELLAQMCEQGPAESGVTLPA